jgi:hypothetical protein
MRFPVFAYPRAEVQARLLARIEAGYTNAALATLQGYPSAATIKRWARKDPAFAARLADARTLGRGVRSQGAVGIRIYDEGRAEAFLLQVRCGQTVGALLRTPGQPNRAALTAWKRQRPDFAAALMDSVRFSRQVRDPRWARYDEAVADRLILRVFHGERLRDLMRDPTLPGRTAIRRWRRLEPAFAGALQAAVRAGYRRQGHTRNRCTPELTDAVAAHILEGGSIHTAARLPGMPHYVTLYAWRHGHPEFARAIALAEQIRNDTLMDRAVAVAEACTPQTLVADRAAIAAARQRVGQLTDGRRSRTR